MGCFSFICKECGKPINSSSFDGDACYLFLLNKGKVIETMHGNYNSYGCVFNKPDFSGSFEWKMDWGDVIDLMFGNDDSSGIAAVHHSCWRGNEYKTKSDDDPNQGWGNSPKKHQNTILAPKHFTN